MSTTFNILFDIRKKLDYKWDKVFKNGTSKICGRQSLKNLKGRTKVGTDKYLLYHHKN